jgi:hypothetical protein
VDRDRLLGLLVGLRLLAFLQREQLLEQPRREAEPERRRVERREDAGQRAELGVERVDPFRAADRSRQLALRLA